MALFSPAYPAPDPSVGIISQFPPGVKENAAVFTHANAFFLVALLAAGLGEEAARLYRALDPSRQPQPRYRMEPYVFSQYVAGPESDRFGQGAFHWMTGSAAWMFRAVLDWMLGLRAELDGLRVDPCIPSSWEHFKVERPYRGALVRLSVRNPEHVVRGVRSLRVDGAERDPAGVVGPFPEHAEVDIDVVMGPSSPAQHPHPR